MGKVNMAAIAVLVMMAAQPCLASRAQFQQWYPQYGFIFEKILQDNCTEQFQHYLTGSKDPNDIDYFDGGSQGTALTQPVVSCLLENSPEMIKAITGSAQVLLGLMPTMLSVVGSSYEEVAMLGCVGRRPLLALILVLGSPSVYFGRAFEDFDPTSILAARSHSLPQIRLGPRSRYIVSFVEYSLAAGAVINVGLLNYQIGIRSICSWMSHIVLGAMLWSLLALSVHMGGALAIRLRARRLPSIRDGDCHFDLDSASESAGGDIDNPIKWLRNLPRSIKEIARHEFVPCVNQKDLHVRIYPENRWYLGLSWLLSMTIVCTIAYGTLFFSAATFIGPRDAITIVCRYLTSTLVCRLVLMYELAGMRENVQVMTTHGRGTARGQSARDADAKSVDSLYIREHPEPITVGAH